MLVSASQDLDDLPPIRDAALPVSRVDFETQLFLSEINIIPVLVFALFAFAAPVNDCHSHLANPEVVLSIDRWGVPAFS
jgi:hypothetical protein